MTSKVERRRRRLRGIIIGLATVAVAAVVLALAGCAGSKHSTVPPAAKASARATASQIARGIKTGQAAKQAEGIVQGCFKHYSGTGLIRCILPYAHHRKIFTTCAYHAFGSDIPGKEVTFVQVDLPNCLVAAR